MIPSGSSTPETRTILGIRFHAGTTRDAIAHALRGGLVVVPSAPVLVNATVEPATQRALLESDLALTDSGLMVLYWNLTRGDQLPRISGLEYLQRLLDEPAMREPGAVFWVMPNDAAIARNRAWLEERGFPVSGDDFYAAPQYGSGELHDPELVDRLTRRRPKHVVLAIGGGVQERLGHSIKQALDYRPGIHCIGAAIGFLNGDQVHIPDWADRFFLGWLFRCLQSPSRFIPRYWAARVLVSILWRYGEKAPPVRG